MLVNNYVRKYSTNHCCIGSTKANTTRSIGQLLQHCLAPFRYSSQIKRMWQELKWDHQEPVVALSRLSQISLVSREVRLYWKATEWVSSTSSSWGFYQIPVPPWLIADVKSGVVFLSDYKSVLPLPHYHTSTTPSSPPLPPPSSWSKTWECQPRKPPWDISKRNGWVSLLLCITNHWYWITELQFASRYGAKPGRDIHEVWMLKI